MDIFCQNIANLFVFPNPKWFWAMTLRCRKIFTNRCPVINPWFKERFTDLIFLWEELRFSVTFFSFFWMLEMLQNNTENNEVKNIQCLFFYFFKERSYSAFRLRFFTTSKVLSTTDTVESSTCLNHDSLDPLKWLLAIAQKWCRELGRYPRLLPALVNQLYLSTT